MAPGVVVAADPSIVTIAVLVAKAADAVGLLKATMKVFAPVNGVAFEIGTENVLAAASPDAQVKVPLALL